MCRQLAAFGDEGRLGVGETTASYFGFLKASLEQDLEDEAAAGAAKVEQDEPSSPSARATLQVEPA